MINGNPDPRMEDNEDLSASVTELKYLNKIAKRPLVDIQFDDLTFTVKDKNSENGKRNILNHVSGIFRSGQLTAILGPSGAGKSTLLNVLTGYNCQNYTGKILVNGYLRDMSLYHKIACYILQEDLVQPYLTVQETMEIAANLKLGDAFNKKEKLLVIDEILTTLGLISCKTIETNKISGGQRKRLAVALELVNNPPVIFLDEPTTGLDVVSIKQCIALLKMLAKNGTSIICTIHQPSASNLAFFDHLYVVAKGSCVYQGHPSLLVPFLEESGSPCPTTHNPADFVIEQLQNNPENIEVMSNLIQNGNISAGSNRNETVGMLNINKEKPFDKDLSIAVKKGLGFPTSVWTQFVILLKRMLLQKYRNKIALNIQLVNHIASPLFLGGIFYGIGNDASKSLTNFMFILTLVVFCTYTYAMVPILIYPADIIYIKREHFNRWYGLNAYFASVLISGLPQMILMTSMSMAITYFLSFQLLEVKRFFYFTITGIIMELCAESYGIALASIFNAKNGSIIAPSIMMILFATSIYGMGFGNRIRPFMRLIMRISFVRYSVAAMSNILLSNRPPMQCDDLYCHYQDSRILMRDVGLEYSTLGMELLGLLLFTTLFRLISYIALTCRFNVLSNSRFVKYLSNIRGK